MASPFGRLLQRIRAAKRVSLRDLGDAVGLSPIYISDIERGNRKPPSPALVIRLATELDADVEKFLRAAMAERKAVELDLSRDGAKREVGLMLARRWDNLDDDRLQRITTILSEVDDDD